MEGFNSMCSNFLNETKNEEQFPKKMYFIMLVLLLFSLVIEGVWVHSKQLLFLLLTLFCGLHIYTGLRYGAMYAMYYGYTNKKSDPGFWPNFILFIIGFVYCLYQFFISFK